MGIGTTCPTFSDVCVSSGKSVHKTGDTLLQVRLVSLSVLYVLISYT